MVRDAHRAVLSLPGVTNVEVAMTSKVRGTQSEPQRRTAPSFSSSATASRSSLWLGYARSVFRRRRALSRSGRGPVEGLPMDLSRVPAAFGPAPARAAASGWCGGLDQGCRPEEVGELARHSDGGDVAGFAARSRPDPPSVAWGQPEPVSGQQTPELQPENPAFKRPRLLAAIGSGAHAWACASGDDLPPPSSRFRGGGSEAETGGEVCVVRVCR